ncbi:T3SS (YopN, CesT) and YbjN peptide-binding chaperone 1 [Friedmanniella luteola]|uniref:T3SS (YopN, CesT) and YbjN peptide-binding chaperone 1 n=1 Tax=Friedmanniella luteola TaxID=546871 RepID=UPI001E5E473C|nr:YbjN domain-containing protein [Friedmanniella luteola]
MADVDDFDLDRSTAQAWTDFQARLAEVVSVMDDTADLTIGVESVSEEPAPFLRFSAPAQDRIRCEAAGNATLGPDFRLDEQQVATLTALGWQAPTAAGPRPSPNFWVEDEQERSDRVSALAVAALRDVYGVQHPVFLAPDQLTEVLRGPAPGSRAVLDRAQQLDALVDEELTRMYGHPPMRDADGDVAIRVGSTMLFLRTSPDGQEVTVFAAVVHDVDGRSRAAEVLNDLNVEARWVKFQLIRDRVFVTFSVLARPFVPEHLQHAVSILSEVADGIDEDLAAKLHGRTTFSEHDGP